jgi:hypothetical protein
MTYMLLNEDPEWTALGWKSCLIRVRVGGIAEKISEATAYFVPCLWGRSADIFLWLAILSLAFT